MNKLAKKTPAERAYAQLTSDGLPSCARRERDTTFTAPRRHEFIDGTLARVDRCFGSLLPQPVPVRAIELVHELAESQLPDSALALEGALRYVITSVDAVCSITDPSLQHDVFAQLIDELAQVRDNLDSEQPIFRARIRSLDLALTG